MQDHELVGLDSASAIGLFIWAVLIPSGDADWMPKAVVFFSTQGLWQRRIPTGHEPGMSVLAALAVLDRGGSEGTN